MKNSIGQLTVYREIFSKESTIGQLYLNGKFLCYTLEDVARQEGLKIYGETAIPQGTYKVIVNRSNRFQRDMPLLLEVPMFEGIRIHGGNTDQNTLGCVLVAHNKTIDKIYGSAEFEVTEALKGFDEIWVTLTTKIC